MITNEVQPAAASRETAIPETSAPLKRVAGFGAWWMLAILFLLYVFSFLDRYILAMLITPIKASLKLTDIEVGLILGPAFAVFYAVFGIPLGWAADRFSRRWVVFFGVSLFGVATACSGLATSFLLLLAARVFVGVGEAALSPAAYSLLADRFPPNLLTTALSIYTMGIKIGSSTAYALGGVVIALAATLVAGVAGLSSLQPWQVVFLLTGAPAILLALLVFSFPEPPRTRIAKKAGQPAASIVRFIGQRQALFIPMFIGFSLISLCSFSLNAWVPTYLTRRFGLSALQYGPSLGVIGMVAALTLVFKGALVDWLYARGIKDIHLRFYTWLLMGSIPFALLLFVVNDALIFMIFYGLVQIVAIPIIAYISAAMQLIVPGELRGRITAVFLFFLTVLGGGIGPLLVSLITDLVFHDEAKLGWSLAIITCTTIPAALVSLRYALKPLKAEAIAAEGREGAAR